MSDPSYDEIKAIVENEFKLLNFSNWKEFAIQERKKRMEGIEQQQANEKLIKVLIDAAKEYMSIDATGTTEKENGLEYIIQKQHAILKRAVHYAQEHGYVDEKINLIDSRGNSGSTDNMAVSGDKTKKET